MGSWPALRDDSPYVPLPALARGHPADRAFEVPVRQLLRPHSGMRPFRLITGSYPNLRGAVVQRRPCPACASEVVQTYRPGRARIYCDAACRQRAYRWRIRHGVRWFAERDGPALRSSTRERRHALRIRHDLRGAMFDHRNRRLTLCGTFARPSYYDRVTHFDYLPDHPWSCASCSALVGGPPPVRFEHGSRK